MEFFQQVKNIWISLSRNLKIIVGSAAVFSSCILCSLFIPDTPSEKSEDILDQEAIAETVMAEIRLELAETEAALPATTSIPSIEIPTLSPSAELESASFDCVPLGKPDIGTVLSVTDGDTIRVSIDGVSYPVRYIGMDTPDSPGSGPSSEFNSDLVSGKTVVLYKDVSNTDIFDRLLRYVFVGDVFVNYELVLQGQATAISYSPDTACDNLFASAQSSAQSAAMGIWAPPPTQSSPQAAIIEIVTVNKQAEYVDIRNSGGQAQNLSGWRLVSERGNQSCTLSGSIAAGATLRIWALSGESGFVCGFSSNIWNNSESDPAVLYDSSGIQVSRYP